MSSNLRPWRKSHCTNWLGLMQKNKGGLLRKKQEKEKHFQPTQLRNVEQGSRKQTAMAGDRVSGEGKGLGPGGLLVANRGQGAPTLRVKQVSSRRFIHQAGLSVFCSPAKSLEVSWAKWKPNHETNYKTNQKKLLGQLRAVK